MLDCEGAVSPEARLVREELLINVSELPNWKDEWKTTKRKMINESTTTVFSRDFVALILIASKEERRGLLICYKSGGDL